MYFAKLSQHAQSAWLRVKGIEDRTDYNERKDCNITATSCTAKSALGLTFPNVDFTLVKNTEAASEWSSASSSISESVQTGSLFSTDSANSGSFSTGASLSTPPSSYLVDWSEIPQLPQFTASALIRTKASAKSVKLEKVARSVTSHASSQTTSNYSTDVLSEDFSGCSMIHPLYSCYSARKNLCAGKSLLQLRTKTFAKVNGNKFYLHDDDSTVDISSEVEIFEDDSPLAYRLALNSRFIESASRDDNILPTISQVLENTVHDGECNDGQWTPLTWMPCAAHPRWQVAPYFHWRIILRDDAQLSHRAPSYYPPGSANPSRPFEFETSFDPLRMIPVGGDYSLRTDFVAKDNTDQTKAATI